MPAHEFDVDLDAIAFARGESSRVPDRPARAPVEAARRRRRVDVVDHREHFLLERGAIAERAGSITTISM